MRHNWSAIANFEQFIGLPFLFCVTLAAFSFVSRNSFEYIWVRDLSTMVWKLCTKLVVNFCAEHKKHQKWRLKIKTHDSPNQKKYMHCNLHSYTF